MSPAKMYYTHQEIHFAISLRHFKNEYFNKMPLKTCLMPEREQFVFQLYLLVDLVPECNRMHSRGTLHYHELVVDARRIVSS